MAKTINISPEEVEATMPDWVKSDIQAVRDLFHASLEWRAEMFAASNDPLARDRIRSYARDWDIAKHTITLAEAERRWGKTNLRQNPIGKPFRWQSDDGRGTWLTTTDAMEEVYGKEPEK